MDNFLENSEFIQKNSPDGGFLQSKKWREFQKNTNKRTFFIKRNGFWASITEHSLPVVGKYFYVPRGPVVNFTEGDPSFREGMQELMTLARKENIGWVRIEPATHDLLRAFEIDNEGKIVKAPHDMQPKEIFVVDISKSEERLLAEMKPKTRYNIGIAKKKGVIIEKERNNDLMEEFLRLTSEMAARQGIATHPADYYRKMLENFPDEMLTIYAARYEGKIIAANLVLFNGEYATYMHGASGNENRNVMAPFLLQWQAMLDAKQRGCMRYDFGGVKTDADYKVKPQDWAGITTFKIGFSPRTNPVVFPGSYDIILNPRKYAVYRGLQRAKSFAKKFTR